MKNLKKTAFVLTILALAFSVIIGCGKANVDLEAEKELSGEITIAGSSTVYPITIIAAEDFMDLHPDVSIAVASTGTGGGFKKWVIGETDINNASSRIKDDQIAEAAKNGITPIELTVAYDGITVVVNKDNDFIDYLSVEELKKIWEPNSKVQTWADVRDGWPAEKIKLYGPGTDSGTFEFFTDKIIGEAFASRTDYSPSEDDNVLVQGVAGDKYSLGYFGYAYYMENQDNLKAVPIATVEKDEAGSVTKVNPAVAPSIDTIEDGSYKPLSREIWIYVSNKSMERSEVAEFVKFYLENADQYAKEAGYIPLAEDYYKKEIEEVTRYLK